MKSILSGQRLAILLCKSQGAEPSILRFLFICMRPASPMVRRKRDFFERGNGHKMNAVRRR